MLYFSDSSKFIGHDLKKEQTEAISSVLSGSDVLVVLLTNFGKSMIYQALSWLYVYLGQRTSPIVLVVSLLVALIKTESSGADEEERDQCSLHW